MTQLPGPRGGPDPVFAGRALADRALADQVLAGRRAAQ
jgi:hypothetical protein